MSLIYGIRTIQNYIRFDFGVCGANFDEKYKFGICDTFDELCKVVDKYQQPLHVEDHFENKKYIMSLNYDLKEINSFEDIK
jgi:hypothetical protein